MGKSNASHELVGNDEFDGIRRLACSNAKSQSQTPKEQFKWFTETAKELGVDDKNKDIDSAFSRLTSRRGSKEHISLRCLAHRL
jgi:hypothetical protein